MNNTIKTLKLVPGVITNTAMDAEFPVGTSVVMDHETCPFEFIVGTGTVVALPDSPDLEHLAGRCVSVRWDDQERYPGVSAPYDPAFLKALIPASEFEAHQIQLAEDRSLEVAAAAHQWQVQKMNEWMAKPIGKKALPGDSLHRVICAVQIIREQAPAYSINELADKSGIPRSTLKSKLRGNSGLTTVDVFRLARAMDVKATDILALSEKGHAETPAEGEPEAEEWNPHLNESQRPAPGIIPPGFEPVDSEWDFFKGKEMSDTRWKIESEWALRTKEFSLTFWAHDDDSMTADETRDYAQALLTMASYITRMSNIMATDTEATK